MTDPMACTPFASDPRHRFWVWRAALAGAVALLAISCGNAGTIEVEQARYRVARQDLGAAYMVITNDTDEAVVLGGASAAGAGRVELHETLAAADGTMSMRERTEGFEIAPGETLRLEPGGPHLMIFDPTEVGDDLEIVLDFGDETVTVPAAFDESQSASMDDEPMDDEDTDEHEAEHG